MKIGFVSLGCSKNLVDSEQIMGMIKRNHHEIVGDPKQAEAIIVNTCGFITSAKEESINTIFEMAQYKEKKCKKLIVCGCLAQRYQEALEQEIPEIDTVIPVRDYAEFASTLQEILKEPFEYTKFERVLSTESWRSYIKISDGCSNHCTYCAIPLIRGDQVSRTIEDIVEEAKTLASYGVKELTLIAQDTSKFGLDNYGKLMLAPLIREINKIEELHWIRILYMYPDEIEDDVLDAMKECEKVLPYFDIPMQHANNRLLKAMNRRGTKEHAYEIIDKIQTMFENPTLRTTLIVGFPGETEEEFEELLEFIEKVKWDRMGAFTYSKEEDTVAYDLTPEVDPDVAQDRLDRLMALQEKISLEKNQQKIGQTIEVIVEEKEALNNRYRGRSRADAPDEVDGKVIFTSDEYLDLGTFVQVEVTDANRYDLFGVCKG